MVDVEAKRTAKVRITPVIMCGGIGSRLWPLSRSLVPKQFMSLVSERTMLQETALRFSNPTLYNPPIVVCGEEHRFLAAEQLRQVGIVAEDIVLEPVARGTLAVGAAAAIRLQAMDSRSLFVLLPADHAIDDPTALHDAMEGAAELAQAGRIVTFGVPPAGPHTGYGYIRIGEIIACRAICYEIAGFIEKPDRETASRLIAGQAHLWNAGMFVVSTEQFLLELEALQPATVEGCRQAVARAERDRDFLRLDRQCFAALPTLSVDHGLMEKTMRGAVIPVKIGWSDVGSWSELWGISRKDSTGNAERGPVHSDRTTGCYLRSDGPLLATIGIKDLVVVAQSDVVMICSREESENVKQMVDRLRIMARREVESHRQVYRPWGSYETVDAGERFQVKRLIVRPGGRLSLQVHRHRAEHWIVVRGQAQVTRDNAVFALKENQSTYIPIGAAHRLENLEDVDLHLIEVQSGSYLGEDDIVRLEDIYGRTAGAPIGAKSATLE